MNAILIEESLKQHGKPYANISYSPDESWIKIEWVGFQTEERSKLGMDRYLELMMKYKIYKVLNDNRMQTGPYPKGIDAWIVEDWYPRAQMFGVKAVATILAENVFTQLSAKGMETKVGKTLNKVFSSEIDAIEWLKQI